MKTRKLVSGCLLLAFLLAPLWTGRAMAASQEELMDKIRLLEQQIQQLRELKDQQNRSQQKEQHCIRAIGNNRLCSCLAEALPVEMDFEQYVRNMAPGAADGESGNAADRSGMVAAQTAHDACVKKGLFW